MVLTFSKKHLQLMQAHAASVYPQECCGLLLGTLVPEEAMRRVAEVVRVDNTWSAEMGDLTEAQLDKEKSFDRRRRYWIDPKALLQIQRDARDRDLNIIGVYHSHPDHPPIPSETDLKFAWPFFSYLILAIEKGEPTQLSSHVLDLNTGVFSKEDLLVN